MKNKKIITRILILILVCGLVYVLDMFVGNPVSYAVVKWHSQSYLEKTYPEQNLQVTKIYQDWYNGGGYDVTVQSPTSRDTGFELAYNRLGMLEWDGYTFSVLSGRSTLSRLCDEYFQAVQESLEPLCIDMVCMPGLSVIDEYTRKAFPLAVGIDMAQLQLDGDYDVLEMGGDYGYLDISMYVSPEELTGEYAAQQLQRIKAVLDEARIGFASIDLFMIVKDTKDANASFGINGICYTDLESGDLPALLNQMHRDQQDYWNGVKTGAES